MSVLAIDAHRNADKENVCKARETREAEANYVSNYVYARIYEHRMHMYTQIE